MLPFLVSYPAHLGSRSVTLNGLRLNGRRCCPALPALHPLTRALLEDLAADDPEVAGGVLAALREAGNAQALLRAGLNHPSGQVRERCRALLEES